MRTLQALVLHKGARIVFLGDGLLFFGLALLAAVLGFSGLAGTFSWVAQIFLVVFLILAIISFFSRAILQLRLDLLELLTSGRHRLARLRMHGKHGQAGRRRAGLARQRTASYTPG